MRNAVRNNEYQKYMKKIKSRRDEYQKKISAGNPLFLHTKEKWAQIKRVFDVYKFKPEKVFDPFAGTGMNLTKLYEALGAVVESYDRSLGTGDSTKIIRKILGKDKNTIYDVVDLDWPKWDHLFKNLPYIFELVEHGFIFMSIYNSQRRMTSVSQKCKLMFGNEKATDLDIIESICSGWAPLQGRKARCVDITRFSIITRAAFKVDLESANNLYKNIISDEELVRAIKSAGGNFRAAFRNIGISDQYTTRLRAKNLLKNKK